MWNVMGDILRGLGADEEQVASLPNVEELEGTEEPEEGEQEPPAAGVLLASLLADHFQGESMFSMVMPMLLGGMSTLTSEEIVAQVAEVGEFCNRFLVRWSELPQGE